MSSLQEFEQLTLNRATADVLIRIDHS